jgi:hypothetical protein
LNQTINPEEEGDVEETIETAEIDGTDSSTLIRERFMEMHNKSEDLTMLYGKNLE